MEPSCLEIVQALRQVNVIKFFDRFEFDQYETFDQQIGHVFTYNNIPIADASDLLRFDREAIASQFVCQGILIDLFQEAVAERVGDGVGTPDDPLGDGIQSVFICVHLWFHFTPF